MTELLPKEVVLKVVHGTCWTIGGFLAGTLAAPYILNLLFNPPRILDDFLFRARLQWKSVKNLFHKKEDRKGD